MCIKFVQFNVDFKTPDARTVDNLLQKIKDEFWVLCIPEDILYGLDIFNKLLDRAREREIAVCIK